MAGEPQTLGEVFRFYHEYVKLLYCDVQATGTLPVEVLFELNAALDHMSRHWVYGESETQVAKKVYSHLKRSCLDIFKLRVKDTVEHYRELQKLDLSSLDNGEFEKGMRILAHDIRVEARAARQREGYIANDTDGYIEAFAVWEPVYEKCIIFDQKFYQQHSNIDWARKRGFRLTIKKFVLGIVTAALVGAFIKDPLADVLKQSWQYVEPQFKKWHRPASGPSPSPTVRLSPSR
jgi:hypothetical protein